MRKNRSTPSKKHQEKPQTKKLKKLKDKETSWLVKTYFKLVQMTRIYNNLPKNKNNKKKKNANQNCKENKKNYLIKEKKKLLRKIRILKELCLLIRMMEINT